MQIIEKFQQVCGEIKMREPDQHIVNSIFELILCFFSSLNWHFCHIRFEWQLNIVISIRGKREREEEKESDLIH